MLIFYIHSYIYDTISKTTQTEITRSLQIMKNDMLNLYIECVCVYFGV